MDAGLSKDFCTPRESASDTAKDLCSMQSPKSIWGDPKLRDGPREQHCQLKFERLGDLISTTNKKAPRMRGSGIREGLEPSTFPLAGGCSNPAELPGHRMATPTSLSSSGAGCERQVPRPGPGPVALLANGVCCVPSIWRTWPNSPCRNDLAQLAFLAAS